MRYGLRELLILLAILPPLLAGALWLAIPFFAATGDAAPIVLGIAAVVLSPCWLPVAWFAWQFKRDHFSGVGFGVFLALEAMSIVLSRFVCANLPD